MINPIAHQRLFNQHIADAPFKTPAEVVRWMGAVQAQEYPAAKWALGLRSQGIKEADVDQALADGEIIRTHMMRPTWHFVAPEDIRWLMALTAPRVHTVNGYMYRQQELDSEVLTRSMDVLTNALQGGKQLTREELGTALAQAGITASGVRLGYIIHYAELECIVCSGGRRGKQFTYALVDERVPPGNTLHREEALAELTRRFFTSHGPAIPKDFVWWSGLTVADVKAGLEMNRAYLVEETVGDLTYWRAINMPDLKEPSQLAYLLPAYDEYTIAYKNHNAILDPAFEEPSKFELYGGVIVIEGQVVGYWRRTISKKTILIELNSFREITAAEREAIEIPAQQYGAFFGMPVQLQPAL